MFHFKRNNTAKDKQLKTITIIGIKIICSKKLGNIKQKGIINTHY